MANIKLSEYCKKNGISYITGYRWFKDGKLPVKATQTESGTILVEDEVAIKPSQPVVDGNTDATALFLKKTLEFSKNNASIEDFAAYIFSNFKLKLHSEEPLAPKYSKIKPKPEEVQEYFRKILVNNANIKEKPKPNMYIPDAETWKSISGDSVSTLGSAVDNGGAKVLENNYATVLSNVSNKVSLTTTPPSVQSNFLSSVGGGTFGASSVAYNCATPASEFSLSNFPETFGDPNLGSTYYISAPEVEIAPDIERTIIEKPKRGRPKKIMRTE